MPNPVIVGAGISGASSLFGASAQKSAAEDAGKAQLKAAELGIAEQRRQFDKVQELLSPFAEGGTDAQRAMMALVGLGPAGAEQAAIQGIEAGPTYQAGLQAGEEAILQKAAATGGLRGGNTQAALAQFRPQMLSQAIDQRYSRLGGLAGMGQASAAGQAAAAQATGANISDLLQQGGAARAGTALASGQAQANMFGGLAQTAGQLLSYAPPQPQGAGVFSKWGF